MTPGLLLHPTVGYCGPPAIPADLWQTWNPDPPVLLGLAVLGVLVQIQTRGSARQAGWGAVALLAVIFVSPLCALSAALFSARVGHHLLLIAGVAPLLAAAFPARRQFPLTTLFVVHTVILWIWHVPGIYDWAVISISGYWLMQATLLGAAFALWREVLRPGSDHGAGMVALLGTVAQMGLVGALILFAPRPLYLVHEWTTTPWGLTPLEDQQLAGLLMWVPAIIPYLAVAVAMGLRLLNSDQGTGQNAGQNTGPAPE